MASLENPATEKPERFHYLKWPNGRTMNVQMKVKYSRHENGQEVEISQNRFKMNEDSISTTTSGTVSSDQHLPRELQKTILSFIFMLIVLLCNVLSAAIIHDRTPNTNETVHAKDYPPLRDITYDVGSSVRGSHAFKLITISEIILVASTVFVVGLLTFHKHKFIVFRRMFFLLTLLFLVRLLTMNVTMLPISSSTLYRCNPKSDHFLAGGVITSRMFDMLSQCGLSSLSGSIKYCGNYVYSGYAVVLILNCLIVGEYCPSWFINLPMRTLTLCSLLFILISGFDYTISIITAYYTTTRLFWIYHTMANNISLKDPREKNLNQICKEWWYPVFRFFEGNVRAVVPPMKCTFR